MFHTCLFEVVELPRADHLSKSAPSQTSFLTSDSASFLRPINHINKVHARASPRTVTVSPALVPPLTEFPSLSQAHLQFQSSYFCLSFSFFSPHKVTHLFQHARIASSSFCHCYIASYEDPLSPSCFFWIFLILAQCFPFHSSFHRSDVPLPRFQTPSPNVTNPSSGSHSNEVWNAAQ